MVALLFRVAGQGTRLPVRREEKGRKKVRVWVQDSNQEPVWIRTGNPGGTGTEIRGAVGARWQVGTPHPRASGVGSTGVAGLGALRGPMVFPTLRAKSNFRKKHEFKVL